MFKKIIATVLCACMVFSVGGCSFVEKTPDGSELSAEVIEQEEEIVPVELKIVSSKEFKMKDKNGKGAVCETNGSLGTVKIGASKDGKLKIATDLNSFEMDAFAKIVTKPVLYKLSSGDNEFYAAVAEIQLSEEYDDSRLIYFIPLTGNNLSVRILPGSLSEKIDDFSAIEVTGFDFTLGKKAYRAIYSLANEKTEPQLIGNGFELIPSESDNLIKLKGDCKVHVGSYFDNEDSVKTIPKDSVIIPTLINEKEGIVEFELYHDENEGEIYWLHYELKDGVAFFGDISKYDLFSGI